jgi:hypothetical protein
MSAAKLKIKPANKKIALSALLILIGCVLPLLIIHFEKPYPHWQPLSLEIIGLGGLGLLFGQLLLRK